MGQPLYVITENGHTTDVGNTDDLPDPANTTIDQLLVSLQKDPVHGWRFSKAPDGSLAFEMEWLGIESQRRPQHLKKRKATIELVSGDQASTLGFKCEQ